MVSQLMVKMKVRFIFINELKYYLAAARVASDSEDDLILNWEPANAGERTVAEATTKAIKVAVRRYGQRHLA